MAAWSVFGDPLVLGRWFACTCLSVITPMVNQPFLVAVWLPFLGGLRGILIGQCWTSKY